MRLPVGLLALARAVDGGRALGASLQRASGLRRGFVAGIAGSSHVVDGKGIVGGDFVDGERGIE